MSRCGTVVAVVLAALLAGCGSTDTTEADRVTATIQDYLRLQSDGDAGKACALLTAGGRQQLTTFVAGQARLSGLLAGALTCDRAIALVRLVAGQDLLQQLRDAKVENVTVDGTSARADVVGAGRIGRRVVRLQLVEGQWRIQAVPGVGG